MRIGCDFLRFYVILYNVEIYAKGGSSVKLIDNLFVAGNVNDLETVVYSLRRGIPVLHLTCIVLFEDKNRLEILSSRDLFHERNKNRPAQIAGIAMGRRAAYDLLAFMTEDAVQNGRDPGDPKELIL